MKKILVANNEPVPDESSGIQSGEVEPQYTEGAREEYEKTVPEPAGPDNKTTSHQIESLLGF